MTFTLKFEFHKVCGYGKLIQLSICRIVMGHFINFVLRVMTNFISPLTIYLTKFSWAEILGIFDPIDGCAGQTMG